MYICTQQVGLGHAWIYIENTAECDLKVGCYDLKPGCGVSMGTFLLSRSDGADFIITSKPIAQINGD